MRGVGRGDGGGVASVEAGRMRTSAVAYKQVGMLLSLLLLLPAVGRLDFTPPIWAATAHSAMLARGATAPLICYLQRS